MNVNLEEKFINDFINASHRDRLLFELKTQKKRLKALMRFSQDIEKLVKAGSIISKSKTFDEKELKKFFKGREFYVISLKYLDGIMMNINEILCHIYDEHLPVIICGEDVAVIKKEFEKGEDNFFFLKNK